MRRLAKPLVIVAAVLLAAVIARPHAETVFLAALILTEVSTPDDDGPLSGLVPDPSVEPVAFSGGPRSFDADLYLPAATPRPRPGIVVVHGMHPDGRRERRLVNFADALARAGFAVLVPEFDGLAGLRVDVADVDEIVAAVEWLRGRPDVDPDRVGIFGLSYSGGLSVLAASDPRIADGVSFVFALGGYCDLRNVVVFMTTGGMREPGGNWTRLEPENHGRWVFLRNSVGLVGDASDAELLASIAEARLADPDADVGATVTALGDEGTAIYELMTCDDPDKTLALLESMSGTVGEYLSALSPRGRMNGLGARLILCHGRSDRMIPYTESLLLAGESPSEVHLEIVDSFRHVDLAFEGAPRADGPVAAAKELAGAARELLKLMSVTCDLVAQGRR